MAQSSSRPRIAILGAGAGGICMGLQLRRAGIESFTIFEKDDGVGGTWRENAYPGAACDVPSHLYSFSFALNADWTRAFASQPEILAYLERCTDEGGLRPHLRLGVEVVACTWDDDAELWHVALADGTVEEFEVVVAACGQLNRPLLPALPGLDSFAGPMLHSARWRSDVELAGKRVGVVGTGASAIQLVPEVAKVAGHLDLFQRSTPWMIPRPDHAYSAERRARFGRSAWRVRLHRWAIYARTESTFAAFRSEGLVHRIAERASRAFLQASVKDPALRATLTPDYPLGCKRLLISNDWYPALQRPNVEVVTSAIAEVSPTGITTADGVHHELDALLLCTGFASTGFLAPMAITGRRGRPLAEAWSEGAEAYLGVAMPDFPNLFVLYGPNTNLAHNSILFMLECQVRLVLGLVLAMRDRALALVEVRPGAMADYGREMQERLASMVWSAGCSNWYVTESGKVTNNWPGHTYEYWWRTRRPDWAAWAAVPRRSAASAAATAAAATASASSTAAT